MCGMADSITCNMHLHILADHVTLSIRETRQLSCKGSQEKAVRLMIESPPAEKHPWTTTNTKSCLFAIILLPYSYTSLLLPYLILPRHPFKVAYFSLQLASAIAGSNVQVQRVTERNLITWGRMASLHSLIHSQPNLYIMIVTASYRLTTIHFIRSVRTVNFTIASLVTSNADICVIIYVNDT